jgi:hypothetical protein
VFGVAPDKVRITFHELHRHDIAVGGVLISDRPGASVVDQGKPGQEARGDG